MTQETMDKIREAAEFIAYDPNASLAVRQQANEIVRILDAEAKEARHN